MKLSELIVKKLNGDISMEEETKLIKWLNESNENQLIFDSLSKMKRDGHHLEELQAVDTQKSYNKFKEGLSKRNKKESHRQKLPYAAVLLGILLLLCGYYFYKNHSANKVHTDYENMVTLELDNGEIYVLDQDKKISNRKGQVLADIADNQISHSINKSKALLYTTLKIPNGKKFDVVLSDGTKVFLNSGSNLRYPINFIDGQTRQVFLSGEAFFDVEEDPQNLFTVTTEFADVQVLGTEFNVSAYPEDLQSNTVLVEGTVRLLSKVKSVSQEQKDVVLKPGFKVQWDGLKGMSELTEVNTDIYTGWIDGKLIFRSLSFKEITKRLERHYDVDIDNAFVDLDEEVFTASFENEPIEEVLLAFSENRKFNYSINDDNIKISKP